MDEKDKNTGPRSYEIFIFIVFTLVWVWSWWQPANPQNWFLENKIVFFSLPLIFLILWRIPLSKLALSAIALFLVLHLIGAHYNYGSVPLGATLGNVFKMGGNLYDKFVHFFFGFLIVYPINELISRIFNLKSFWNYFISFNIILAWSALYEIIEWLSVFGIDPHLAYLFIGGNDPFDTTKDMAVAGLGALLALCLVALFKKVETK